MNYIHSSNVHLEFLALGLQEEPELRKISSSLTLHCFKGRQEYRAYVLFRRGLFLYIKSNNFPDASSVPSCVLGPGDPKMNQPLILRAR